MELTKRQIRRLVKAGKIREDEFLNAFDKTRQDYSVSLLDGGGIRVWSVSGHAIADIDATYKITMIPDRQDWLVEIDNGFVRLFKYNEEAGGQK